MADPTNPFAGGFTTGDAPAAPAAPDPHDPFKGGFTVEPDPNAPPPKPPVSTAGTTAAGAVQGIVGYPETAAQAAERASGYHFVPRWLAQKGAHLKTYAEQTPAGRAAEFGTSVGATIPFRTEGLVPGALASIFNQPVLNASSNEDYWRTLGERGIVGAVPLLGLTGIAAHDRPTQEFYDWIYNGTGAKPPTRDVNPGAKAVIRNDLGGRLNVVNSRLTMTPQNMTQLAASVAQDLTPAAQARWAKIFKDYVEDPAMANPNMTGRDFADYLSDMTAERTRLAQGARGAGRDSDEWKMVRGLRAIHRQIAQSASGSAADKALQSRLLRAYARWGVLDTAAQARNGGRATARQLISAAENHSHNYSRDYANDPFLRRLERHRYSEAARGTEASLPAPANLALSALLYHMSPMLGAGHAGYWMAHRALDRLAHNAAVRRALDAAARRTATVGAVAGQAQQAASNLSPTGGYSP
jgi:hypothetical protein